VRREGRRVWCRSLLACRVDRQENGRVRKLTYLFSLELSACGLCKDVLCRFSLSWPLPAFHRSRSHPFFKLFRLSLASKSM